MRCNVQLAVLMVFIGILAGCEVKEISAHDFARAIASHNTETINNVWYCGSDETWDYFVHNTAIKRKLYKVHCGQIPLALKIPRTNDEPSWICIKRNSEVLFLTIPDDAVIVVTDDNAVLKNDDDEIK